jgi:hypothetical protein
MPYPLGCPRAHGSVSAHPHKRGTDRPNAPRFPRARGPGNGAEPDLFIDRLRSVTAVPQTLAASPSSLQDSGPLPLPAVFLSNFRKEVFITSHKALLIVCTTPARSPNREYGGRLI